MGVNSRYSLRSFARDLKVSPGRLSEILSKKQGLSQDSAKNLAHILKLSEQETLHFTQLVLSIDGRSKKAKIQAKKSLKIFALTKSITTINATIFDLIKDWHHFAIIELLKCNLQSTSPEILALQLGLKVEETKISLKLLQDLNLIHYKNGKYISLEKKFTTLDGDYSLAIRHFNSQILEKARLAIFDQGIDQRYLSTLTIALHKSHLKKVTKLIAKQRRELNEYITKLSEIEKTAPNAVYSIATQCFELTKQVH